MFGDLPRVLLASSAVAICLGCASVIAVDPDAGEPDAGEPDAGEPDACVSGAVCVPSVPTGWSGPVVVGEDPTDPPACPAEYPATIFVTQRDLVAPPADCNCGCVVSSALCSLFSENNDTFYVPGGSCDDPPSPNDCLSAVVDAACSTNSSNTLPPLSWETQARVCEGAGPQDACDGGACFAGPSGFGPICIFQDGDQPCPGGFPERTVYFGDASDARGCDACGCSVTGGQCEVEIEVCSVGFFSRTIMSGDEPFCLPDPGDGDGVSLLLQTITAQPACTPSDGTPTGEAAPDEPLTVCCL
jgi:hypothetical protein